MLRQYRSIASPGSAPRGFHRVFARSFLLGLACAVLGLVCSPAALSAAREPKPAAEALWEAFPLNPTGERIRGRAFRPPVQPEAVVRAFKAELAVTQADAPTSGADVILLALLVGVGILSLLAVVVVASGHLRRASVHPRAPSATQKREPSAYISAVFIGTRRVPIIESVARRKQRVVWTTGAAPMIVGLALAALVVVLILLLVG